MTTFNPRANELFVVHCNRMEKTGDSLSFGTRLTRSRDYEHLVFAAVTSDDTFVVGKPASGGFSTDPKPILLRRADFDFVRLSPEVAASIGLTQIEPVEAEPNAEV